MAEVDKSQYSQIQSLIEGNPSISGFDLYYLGFFSHYAPQLNLEDIFKHINNIISMHHDDLISTEEKIEFLIRMLSKKVDQKLLQTIVPIVEEFGEESKKLLADYFSQIMRLIPLYDSINKFELFYLGLFHAFCPSYSIDELFNHINNINQLVKEDLIDEETQIDFLLKILNKKISDNKHKQKQLFIPKIEEGCNDQIQFAKRKRDKDDDDENDNNDPDIIGPDGNKPSNTTKKVKNTQNSKESNQQDGTKGEKNESSSNNKKNAPQDEPATQTAKKSRKRSTKKKETTTKKKDTTKSKSKKKSKTTLKPEKKEFVEEEEEERDLEKEKEDRKMAFILDSEDLAIPYIDSQNDKFFGQFTFQNKTLPSQKMKSQGTGAQQSQLFSYESKDSLQSDDQEKYLKESTSKKKAQTSRKKKIKTSQKKKDEEEKFKIETDSKLKKSNNTLDSDFINALLDSNTQDSQKIKQNSAQKEASKRLSFETEEPNKINQQFESSDPNTDNWAMRRIPTLKPSETIESVPEPEIPSPHRPSKSKLINSKIGSNEWKYTLFELDGGEQQMKQLESQQSNEKKIESQGIQENAQGFRTQFTFNEQDQKLVPLNKHNSSLESKDHASTQEFEKKFKNFYRKKDGEEVQNQTITEEETSKTKPISQGSIKTSSSSGPQNMASIPIHPPHYIKYNKDDYKVEHSDKEHSRKKHIRSPGASDENSKSRKLKVQCTPTSSKNRNFRMVGSSESKIEKTGEEDEKRDLDLDDLFSGENSKFDEKGSSIKKSLKKATVPAFLGKNAQNIGE